MPDRQVAQSETLEWIADSIARRGLPFSAFINSVEYMNALNFIRREVLSALRNERENCAKVADAKAAYHVLRHAEFLSGHARIAAGHSGSKAEACSEVASAIREGR